MELRKHGPEFEDATMENARPQQTAARVTWPVAFWAIAGTVSVHTDSSC